MVKSYFWYNFLIEKTQIMPFKPLKIYFYSMDGMCHLNASAGMAQTLAKRGHTVCFLLNEAFKGEFAKFGFEEVLLKLKPKNTKKNLDQNNNVVKQNAENLLKSGFLSAKSPLEKMQDQMNSGKENEFIASMYDDMLEFNPQIEKMLQIGKPHIVIVDSFLVPPAIQQAPIPWAFLCSATPLCVLKSKKLPPHGSGMLKFSLNNYQKYFTCRNFNK